MVAGHGGCLAEVLAARPPHPEFGAVRRSTLSSARRCTFALWSPLPCPPAGLQLELPAIHEVKPRAHRPMQATLNQQPSDRSFALPTRPTESRRAPPSQDRPFSCPIPTCGGRFHRKFTLHEHMKTHTGEQPHQCPVVGCGKRFSTSGNLARHRKLHSVHKLNCPTPHCSREFTNREKLMRHLKVHLAGTPHTCTIEGCGKTFSTAGNLTRHRRTRHNAPPINRAAGMDAPRQPLMLKSLPFPEQQQRQFPMQAIPSRMVHYPVVPGAMLVKAPVWSAAPTQEAVTARPDYNRISDQDVRDLLDCLFVENPAVAPVNNMGGIIRSEPFLRGAYHP